MGHDAPKAFTMSSGLALLLTVCLTFASLVHATPLVNGDFETGDLSGWTVFSTANGTVGWAGFPVVLDFDMNGDGATSKSVGFKVGQQVFKGIDASPEGGGIYTMLTVEPGRLTVTAEIAASYASQRHRRNLSAGIFELMLDDAVLDSHDFGPISAGTTERATLSGSKAIAGGAHALRLRIRRPAITTMHSPAPFQFVDNIKLTFTPLPSQP